MSKASSWLVVHEATSRSQTHGKKEKMDEGGMRSWICSWQSIRRTDLILVRRPWVFTNVWVQLVVPSLAHLHVCMYVCGGACACACVHRQRPT